LSRLRDDQRRVSDNYHCILDDNIAKELARINLPLSTYTEWYWRQDAHNLFHFLKLRLDKHAQWEIQQYGLAIAEIVKKVIPVAWNAFERHVLRQTKFCPEEIEAIRQLMNGHPNPLSGQRLMDFQQKIEPK